MSDLNPAGEQHLVRIERIDVFGHHTVKNHLEYSTGERDLRVKLLKQMHPDARITVRTRKVFYSDWESPDGAAAS